MAVDQQVERRIGGVARKVDFAGQRGRERVEPVVGVKAQVMRADRNVVDVEQQPAAGAAAQFGEKVDLAPFVPVEREIVRGVLDQDRAPQRRLRGVDVAHDLRQRQGGSRKRQEVGKAVPTAP